MIELKDLLTRFQNILLSEEAKTESVRDIIGRAIKLDIKKEDIKIKNGVIYLNIRPIYKNEILLKSEKIFSELEQSFGKKSPKSIR